MSALEMAMQMWPMWILGFFMLYVTVTTGNADLIRVDRKTVIKWLKFLSVITVIRAVLWYFTWDYSVNRFEAVSWLPWETTTMVWWEDAAHTLPLFLLARLIGTKWKTWPVHALAFTVIWLSFLTGHLYQGLGSAILISMYIPFSLKLGKEIGLGTLMINHVLYDLATLLLIQGMIRLM